MSVDQVFWIIILVLLVGYCASGGPSSQSNTANLILDAKRACEAQTGQPCSTP